MWEQKDMNVDCDISSKVLQRAHPYKGGGSRCDLCAAKKLNILKNLNAQNSKYNINCDMTKKW